MAVDGRRWRRWLRIARFAALPRLWRYTGSPGSARGSRCSFTPTRRVRRPTLRITQSRFLKLLHAEPAIAIALLRELATRLRKQTTA